MNQSPLKPKLKKRHCISCKSEFMQVRLTQKACSVDCAFRAAQVVREKKEKAAKRLEAAVLKSKKEAIKPRSKWLAEAQAAFNAFIRERDRALPCISCGRFHTGSYDAGHFRTVGAMPALRFNELNVHKQCVPCNQHKGGNIVEYRIRLIMKIGEDSLAWLEGPHEAAKYSIEDAKCIKAEYKAKLKELKGKNNAVLSRV